MTAFDVRGSEMVVHGLVCGIVLQEDVLFDRWMVVVWRWRVEALFGGDLDCFKA